MSHIVTNYREVKYDMDTKVEALHWNDFIAEVGFTEFGEEGDYYAVYEDLDEEDDHDRKKYAIYLHSTGKLLCLLGDSGLVLDCCYDDMDYATKRNELYRQIAMLAGWPEKIETKKPYRVTIKRTIDVKVYAVNKYEAQVIGDALASGATDVACMVVNEAMCNGDDECVSIDDRETWYHGALTVDECNNILKAVEED